MPEPTILVINQDMDTTDFCRQSVNMLFEAWLGMDGHEFKVVKSVREVTPEQYAQWDCVLAHVNMSELRELEQLALSHPEVGLIYTTGEGIAPEYQRVFLDVHRNRYFLPKPFDRKTFRDAVKRVVFEAKGS